MIRVVVTLFFIILLLASPAANAALIDQINQAFREVYGRTPTQIEWSYWAGRVTRKEKTTYAALVGAMYYAKAQGNGGTVAATTVSSTATPTAGFKAATTAYPSSLNPNFLPDGTLVKSPTKPEVFYIKGGKKSWVLPSIINRWLGENHYFKHDIIITISDSDLARYPQTKSVNSLYAGKVLVHPNGTKFYIDDKLRRRAISDNVRSAFKFPAGNFYPTSDTHLKEFPIGPAITTADKYLGGMVVYTGPYHGGRFWKIEEVAGGALVKRLYLSDYLYEADGYPDESQRVPANETILAKHTRGANIERYPDGWVVGLGGNIYVVQGGKLRLITSPAVFSALGYKNKYTLTVFPEFLKRYPHGHSISAFKSVVANGTATKGGPAPAPSAATNLTKVRPIVRSLITEMNNIYISVFDKDVTASENKFWVDYVYNGEVNNKADLIQKMQIARETGKKPALTPRTSPISLDKLKSHWFPYLFYFVHQKEPDSGDTEYWHARINSSDRNTIEKLGGTIQWVKENFNATRR